MGGVSREGLMEAAWESGNLAPGERISLELSGGKHYLGGGRSRYKWMRWSKEGGSVEVWKGRATGLASIYGSNEIGSTFMWAEQWCEAVQTCFKGSFRLLLCWEQSTGDFRAETQRLVTAIWTRNDEDLGPGVVLHAVKKGGKLWNYFKFRDNKIG